MEISCLGNVNQILYFYKKNPQFLEIPFEGNFYFFIDLRNVCMKIFYLNNANKMLHLNEKSSILIHFPLRKIVNSIQIFKIVGLKTSTSIVQTKINIFIQKC